MEENMCMMTARYTVLLSERIGDLLFLYTKKDIYDEVTSNIMELKV